MNHHSGPPPARASLAMAFVIAGLAACGERLSDTRARRREPAAAEPLGRRDRAGARASPTGDPPGTTPVASAPHDRGDASRSSGAMPQPGQPNDHSNLAPKPSQKADEMATTAEEGKAANDGERTQ